jgi:hypothetical protein
MPGKSVARIWKDELRNRSFLAESILTLATLIAVIRLVGYAVNFIDERKGVLLPDPILAQFAPVNVTWVTFGILWPSLIVAVCFLVHDPRRLVMAFQAVTLVLLFRTLTLLLMPFEPLPTIIPLADPIIVNFATGKLVLKDLFFSGHTSAMFLAFLTASRAWLKPIFLIGTIIVAICVLLQHVHYSCDVFAAPFFTYASWRIILGLHAYFGAPLLKTA